MSPSPDQQQQGRYRSAMQGGQQLNPGQMPMGGPPSFTGGTPSGQQPMNAGAQQRGPMPAPMGDTPMPAQGGMGTTMAPQGVAGAANAAAAAQRMPAPWTPPPAGGAPMGGQDARPQYQGGPGAAQRMQMSAPQAPASPISQRQQMQNQQNRGM